MDISFKPVSADSHVVEPPDLSTHRIDRAYLDRAPRIVREDESDVFVCPGAHRREDGDRLHLRGAEAGGSIFELMQPIARRTPLDDYPRLRGEGWYAVNFRVKPAKKAAAYLKSHGLRLVGDERTRWTPTAS